MNLPSQNRLRPGAIYKGPTMWVDRDESGVLGIPSGYYALAENGRGIRRPLVRLVCVDDAPGDVLNGACHFVVATKGDPVQTAAGGRFVQMSATMKGSAAVSS